MLWQILVIMGGCGVLGITLWLASKNGSKSAQLEALKTELKKRSEEQAKANEILDNVRGFDEHTCRQRLHSISRKQR